MITSLEIKNITTYSNTGVKFDNLKKVNYIFGNNGVGKSTIATYINSLTAQNTSQEYPNCNQHGFDATKEDILVFDENFIKNNFVQNEKLKGIFFMNKQNANIDNKIRENNEQIATLNSQKGIIEENFSELENNINKMQDNTINACWSKRDIFKSFSKIKLKHGGNKVNNYKRLEQLLNNGEFEKPNLDDLSVTYKKLYEENLFLIDISIDENNINKIITLEKELQPLLNEVIVGKQDVQLARMIDKFGLKSWVAQGKEFLNKTGKICPFCQKQTIDDNFISQLNDIFDESYKQKVTNLKSKKSEYEEITRSFTNSIARVSKSYNKNSSVSNIQIELDKHFKNVIKIIAEKITLPNEKKSIDIINDKIIDNIKQINKEISENNEIIQSRNKQEDQLTEKIWQYLAKECFGIIGDYEGKEIKNKNKQQELNTQKNSLESQIQKLNAENATLRTQTVNTKEAADNINALLKNSGFIGFSIEEAEKENNISQYRLSRQNDNQENTNIYNTLSEGEKRFIAFLYFYQTCLGNTDISKENSKKKILVIDDPITSMDSQVLFIVSTLINRLIGQAENNKKEFANRNISQVFILTHNFYFYKEVALRQRPICKEQKHFIISKNIQNKTYIFQTKSEIIGMDDYSLMWETIKNIKNDTVNKNDCSQNIALSNLFRRILESYANFVGLGENAWATILDNDKESSDCVLKCAFISIINDESHKTSPLDNLYFEKIRNENPAKLFNIFKSIFMNIEGGKLHYETMMGENKNKDDD